MGNGKDERNDGRAKRSSNDFFNVLELTRDLNNYWTEMGGRIDAATYMVQILQIQLGMLQQLTMISKHSEQFAKALSNIAAEVERTAAKK